MKNIIFIIIMCLIQQSWAQVISGNTKSHRETTYYISARPNPNNNTLPLVYDIKTTRLETTSVQNPGKKDNAIITDSLRKEWIEDAIMQQPQNKKIGLSIVRSDNSNQSIVLNYVLPVGENRATITITNSDGKIIVVMRINNQVGKKLWDVHNVEPGIYQFILKSSGFKQSTEIVIRH